MKYKVGDPVIGGSEKGKIVKAPYNSNTGNEVVHVRWESGGITEEWVGNVAYDYRSLYEQEKALREAAEKFIEESPCDPDIYPEQLEAWNYYQQLKQNNNGTINTSNT